MKIKSAKTFAVHCLKYNGPQHIEGTLETKGESKNEIMPFCAVHLFDQRTSARIHTTLSDAVGKYAFKNVDLEKFTFFVIAHHPAGEYNGVIADNIHGVQDVEP